MKSLHANALKRSSLAFNRTNAPPCLRTDAAMLVAYMQEHQSSVPDAQAAQHFFEDIATQNEATSSTFEGTAPTGMLRTL